MTGIGNSLKIKYGLADAPAEAAIQLWAERARRYITLGFEQEESGHRAARDTFPDYQTWSYKSQADTILALLAQITKR